VIWILILAAGVSGILIGGRSAVTGFLSLQYHPARLLQDFAASVGVGGALLNAGLVAALGLGLVHLAGIQLSGPTLAAVFTMFGFGLFGKTPLNAAPIIAGVAVAARLADRRFGEYILIALFGTALGPIVSLVAAELVPGGIGLATLAAILAGLATGVVLPAVAIAMLRLHQGYSLYNVGLTSGMVAVFVAAGVRAAHPDLPPVGVWDPAGTPVLEGAVVITSVVLVLAGMVLGGHGTLRRTYGLLAFDGRLPSDFCDLASVDAALVNMGAMGIASWAVVRGLAAPMNAAVAGAVFTVIGFAAFGKHPRNSWPVVAGVILTAIVFGKPLTDPGVILAALFVTTLAPVAGQFGPVVGILAGAAHLLLVLQTGAWHAGMTLYNNGFAAGLVATMVVAIVEWYQANVSQRDRRFTR